MSKGFKSWVRNIEIEGIFEKEWSGGREGMLDLKRSTVLRSDGGSFPVMERKAEESLSRDNVLNVNSLLWPELVKWKHLLVYFHSFTQCFLTFENWPPNNPETAVKMFVTFLPSLCSIILSKIGVTSLDVSEEETGNENNEVGRGFPLWCKKK